jgi:hypothetical protein
MCPSKKDPGAEKGSHDGYYLTSFQASNSCFCTGLYIKGSPKMGSSQPKQPPMWITILRPKTLTFEPNYAIL